MSLQEIYQEAALDSEDIQMMDAYINNRVEFYDSPAFQKLYEYFAFKTGEMPYEVAKARTETPDVWILEHLESLA
jgi:hypothetical protein